MTNRNIRKSVERSSLGTRKAVAARRTVTTAAAAKVVAQSARSGRFGRKNRPKTGG